MTPREELEALRRLNELESKAGGGAATTTEPAAPAGPSMGDKLFELGRVAVRGLPGGSIASLPFDTQRNLGAGLVRGAGSIGATLALPFDWAMDKLGGNGQPNLSSLVTGKKLLSRNDQRREDMDLALGQLGADTSAPEYSGGKLISEVAGTGGVGGAMGKLALMAVPKLAPAVVTALQTGGIGKQAGNVLTRMFGGAVTGGTSAALIDPAVVNAGLGAVIGGAIPGAGAIAKTVGPAIQSGLDAAGRLTAKGRQEAAVRLLQKAGIDKQMTSGMGSNVTASGAAPVLSERIPVSDPKTASKVAQIQDALRTANPDLAAQMTEREAANNAARVKTLRDMAGEGGGRDFAAANRVGTSGPMYDEAFAALPDAANTGERELRQLMRTPALREAAERARTNAANKGMNVGPSNASGSVEGLHQMKMALDDMISKAEAKATGSAANEAEGLKAAQKRLVSYIESVSPEYANARGVHRQMSVPINQMDVAGEVLRKGSAATSDLGGVPRLMPDAYLRTMGGDNALVKAATGRDLGSLENVMDPAQMNKLRAIGQELDKQAAVGRAANGPGSATAKRMMQGKYGMLRNAGAGGLSDAVLPMALAPFTGGLSVLAAAGKEGSNYLTRKTQEELGRLLMDPAALNTLLSAPARTLSPAEQQLRSLAEQALRRAPVAAASANEGP